MDKSSRTNGGNGRSLCNHHPSGASSYSFTRACNELARVYHAARESYLLERNVITSHTFLRTTGQHHPITLPMLKKQDTRSTRTSIKEKTGPFSFFHWIFIHPQSHTESEISEIITHEETHARQYHSVDVLISEIMCIFCWFNPFIWLMKREVRGNLEYMADHRVLETGHDSKSYQYHLLGLAHHKAAANLSNSFNVLPLKNRIKMMNKRRTKEIGRTKYLMFLPLAAILMIVSNIEMVARTTEKFAKEMMGQATEEVAMQAETTDIPELPTEDIQGTTLPRDKQEKEMAETQIKSVPDSVVFQVVEEMPDFPGGVQALMDYLSKNVRYPAEAHAIGAQGRVIVSFTVKKDGSIADTKVERSVNPYLDKEAMRVIAAMPKWKPGKQRGKQ